MRLAVSGGQDLRMQLALRQVVDDMLRDGWEIVTRTPVLLVHRGRVMKKIVSVGTVHAVITI